MTRIANDEAIRDEAVQQIGKLRESIMTACANARSQLAVMSRHCEFFGTEDAIDALNKAVTDMESEFLNQLLDDEGDFSGTVTRVLENEAYIGETA